jgi:hypothetical protein
MSYEMLESPVELTDAELDAVAAGKNSSPALVNVSDVNVNVAAQALTAHSGQVFTPIQP